MGQLSINKKTLDNYFGFLMNLDVSSKKRLIIKLTESIKLNKERKSKLETLCGAWEDDRTTEEIIADLSQSFKTKTPTQTETTALHPNKHSWL